MVESGRVVPLCPHPRCKARPQDQCSTVLTHLLLQRTELALGGEAGNKTNEYSPLVSGKCDGDK